MQFNKNLLYAPFELNEKTFGNNDEFLYVIDTYTITITVNTNIASVTLTYVNQFGKSVTTTFSTSSSVIVLANSTYKYSAKTVSSDYDVVYDPTSTTGKVTANFTIKPTAKATKTVTVQVQNGPTINYSILWYYNSAGTYTRLTLQGTWGTSIVAQLNTRYTYTGYYTSGSSVTGGGTIYSTTTLIYIG